MKLLLERGADVNAANKRKSTPLFWSLHDESKVRLLLDSGASISAKTIDGRTPVYQAASMADAVPILRLLLDKGADANAKTLTGMTPLMAAAGQYRSGPPSDRAEGRRQCEERGQRNRSHGRRANG